MTTWAYGDCGYGIAPADWHHGEGYLPVQIPADFPGEGCER